MKKSSKLIVCDCVGFLGAALLCICGILILFGCIENNQSVLSRAGGLAMTVLYLWVTISYAKNIRGWYSNLSNL
jgi:hypothetical protein